MNRKNIMRASLFMLGLQVAVLAGCSQQKTGTAAQEISQEPKEKQSLAFPGAEGFGKYTTGGRGGKVMVVTNLNDSGPGSLREAIQAEGARTVVFAVSGTIALESPLEITNGDLTIAGQSAPGDGICIRNYNVGVKADNVIIRYMRFRLGDERNQQDDAITGLRRKNIVIDHCSMSWATDECASFYDNENFTMQWCIISESLNASVHEKGEHGYGGIWGGKGASFHHNLLVSHKSRMPRFCGSRYHKQPEQEVVDYRNNVIYNWKDNNLYAGEKGNHNVVNNYYKQGPATSGQRQNQILNPWAPYGNYYVAGNFFEGNAEVTQNNKLGVLSEHPDSALVAAPVSVMAIPDQSATAAYEEVLAHAGASYRRDAVDERIMEEVRTGNATYGKNKDGIIDSQKEVGGWPELKSAQVPEDKDQDGMPDAWERRHKLDPANPTDAAAYLLDKQYTNLEIYLNSLVEEQRL